jgi:hypothetical protein
MQAFEEKIRRNAGAGGPPPEPPVDPRELDSILVEIAGICQKEALFDRFLRVNALVHRCVFVISMVSTGTPFTG